MAKKRKPAARSRTSKRTRRVTKPLREPQAESYRHPTAESLLRPEVGTQAQFRKKKPPVTYRYDSSLSPAMESRLAPPLRATMVAVLHPGLRRGFASVREPQHTRGRA